MLQMADSRRRFVMPKEALIGPNDPAEVELLPDGRVIISPVRVIPVHELWALTPESTAQTEAAMKDYKAGRTLSVKALDAKIAAGSSNRGRK
ncbi:hypothetical protein [Geothrix sp. 21YS21S-2]|uniref:hypothetical protein n=1 Tax=Geothrix sp. 21YS21S-2 TaxID=3068893 RepID=UPI0027B8D2CB|nr:hypothetical protein [Geothrix sp. 21YS21S-2]